MEERKIALRLECAADTLAPGGGLTYSIPEEYQRREALLILSSNVVTDPRHPRRAPQFICSGCRKKIAKTRDVHTLTGSRAVVLCFRCLDDPAGHARWFPDCPEQWHDLWDHLGAFGTRAGVAAYLGLWPPAAAARGTVDAVNHRSVR